MFVLIDADGSVLRCSKGRLAVTKERSALAEYLVSEVDAVILAGRVEVTRAAADVLLRHRIPTHFLSRAGRYLGSLHPPERTSPHVRLAQYRLLQTDLARLRLARSGLAASLANLRAVMRRWSVHRDAPAVDEAICEVDQLRELVPDTTTLSELRGIEGSAWRHAYAAAASLLDPDLGFSCRLRRPAPDPVNAVLGLFGSITASHAVSHILSTGLDPGLGYSHGSSRGSPALALDLTDIYRPMLCLAPTVALFTKGVLDRSDFRMVGRAAALTDEGRSKAFAAYAAACQREVARREDASPKSHLRQMLADARSLARAMADEADWEPLVIR